MARAGREGKLTLGDRLVLKRRHGKRGEAESRRSTRAEAESAPLSFSARRHSHRLGRLACSPRPCRSTSRATMASLYWPLQTLSLPLPRPAMHRRLDPERRRAPCRASTSNPHAHTEPPHTRSRPTRETHSAGETRLVQFGHIDHLRYRLVSTPDSQPPTSAYPTPNNNPPQPDSVTDR